MYVTSKKLLTSFKYKVITKLTIFNHHAKSFLQNQKESYFSNLNKHYSVDNITKEDLIDENKEL